MITTVTLNPAIDKTLTIEHFAANQVNRIQSIQENLGGKGINVSKVLSTLGSVSMAIGFIGQRNQSKVLNFIAQEKLSTNFVPIDADTRTNTKIIDPITQNTTDINEPGFTVNEDHLTKIQSLIDHYSRQSSFMVFSGSVCKGVSASAYTQLLQSVSAPCKVVLDAEGEMLKAGLKASPFLIKPNIHELRQLIGLPLETETEVIQACLGLIKDYHLTYVLLSQGEHGSLLISKDQVLKASALKVTVVSTVGAGDSMLAGFLHSYEKDQDPTTALRFGACTGSIAVQGISTDAFKHISIHDQLKHITITTQPLQEKNT